MEKWWNIPGVNGYVIEYSGQAPIVVDMQGNYVKQYDGGILPIALFANAEELSNSEIEKIKITKKSLDAGYQAGLYPTEQSIIQGCPDGLDEKSWLNVYIKGQDARKGQNLI